MRVVAVAGAKGGVGKTAAAVNLAMLAAEAGHRTLLWDLDPQGAATHCYRARARVKGGATRLLGGKLDRDPCLFLVLGHRLLAFFRKAL